MLEVRLLGKFAIKLNGKPVTISSRAAQSLFAYLILTAGTLHRREKLAGVFWRDTTEEKARAYLRHELWLIRKSLFSKSKIDYLIADDINISFNASVAYWLDVKILRNVSGTVSTEELMKGLSLFQGELLPGFYDDWITQEREHLQAVYEQKIVHLLELLESEKRWHEIREWAERWISFGQGPEVSYRYLMIAYDALGDRAKVTSTYQRCVQALREMELEPSEETRAIAFKRSSKLNIPIPLTSFIGRETELKEVAALFSKSRLITLTGSGGVGKTRLAIQVVSEVLDRFPDGIWFLDLAPLNNPALVQNTLANMLGLREAGDISLIELLINYFRSRNALIIFDNCEHLIESCARLVNSLLISCESLSVLATSREVLRVSGEIPYRVPSLDLPLLDSRSTIDILKHVESIRLFGERARVVWPEFAIDSQNVSIIAQICKRLDGIALAIELAAARVKLLKLEQIVERLDDAFHLLTGGSRTALPRHQTLRGTLDWSYGLLTEKEQILLRRLSVFMDGWTLELAEEVCGHNDMLEQLSHLVDKSLVFVNQENGNEPRYYLHETIRQYAREKLIKSGEYTASRKKHRDVFLNFVERIEPELIRAQQKKWLKVLESEIDNLRTAFNWSLENKDAEQAIRFCSGLYFFWSRKFHSIEAALAAKQGLALANEHDGLNMTFWYAATLLALIDFTFETEWKLPSDPFLLPLLKQAHAIFNSINIYTSPAPVIVAQNIAWVYMDSNDLSLAEIHLSELYEKLTASNYQWGIARTKISLAQLSLRKGDIVTWQKLFQEALELFILCGDEWSVKDISQQLIWEKYLHGEFEDARRLSEQNILLYEQEGESNRAAQYYMTLGLIAFYRGQYEVAQQYFLDSTKIWLELDDLFGATNPKRYFAFLLYKIGRLSEANAEYRNLIAQLKKIPEGYLYGALRGDYALLCLYENRLDEARNSLVIALEVLKKTSPETDVWSPYFGFGELARLEKNYREAAVNYRACLHYANNYFNYKSFPMIVDGIAKTHCMLSNFERAACLFGISGALRKKMGAVVHPIDRPDYDKHIELLKSKMSAEEFESSWEKGANMSIEEAYEYAVHG